MNVEKFMIQENTRRGPMKTKGFVSVAYDKNDEEIARTRPYDTDKEGDKLRDALLKQFPNLHHIRVL